MTSPVAETIIGLIADLDRDDLEALAASIRERVGITVDINVEELASLDKAAYTSLLLKRIARIEMHLGRAMTPLEQVRTTHWLGQPFHYSGGLSIGSVVEVGGVKGVVCLGRRSSAKVPVMFGNGRKLVDPRKLSIVWQYPRR